MRRESSRLGEIGLIYLIKQIAWGFNFEMSGGGVVAVVVCLEPPTPLFSSSVC